MNTKNEFFVESMDEVFTAMNEGRRLSYLKLYDALMALQSNDAFYYVDQEFKGTYYRIFLYRLASYGDFMLPGAIESRGITFEMQMYDGVLEPFDLVCLPMQKFFNLGENPLTIGLNSDDIARVMHKLDGSLISTVFSNTDNGYIVKTKGSFHSEQARAAAELLKLERFAELDKYCRLMTMCGYTVNMEYTAPDNRVVIGYNEPNLTILNVRHTRTGKYVPHTEIPKNLRVAEYPFMELAASKQEFVDSIKSMKGIEGFVMEYTNGLWVKVKTDEYCSLHKTKDNLNSERKLFEACVLGAADDLIGLFADDLAAVDKIKKMQQYVYAQYNAASKTIQTFYAENSHLSRKDYAILGQEKLKGSGLFSLAMNLFLGKDANVEEFMIKNYKLYGIKEDVNESE